MMSIKPSKSSEKNALHFPPIFFPGRRSWHPFLLAPSWARGKWASSFCSLKPPSRWGMRWRFSSAFLAREASVGTLWPQDRRPALRGASAACVVPWRRTPAQGACGCFALEEVVHFWKQMIGNEHVRSFPQKNEWNLETISCCLVGQTPGFWKISTSSKYIFVWDLCVRHHPVPFFQPMKRSSEFCRCEVVIGLAFGCKCCCCCNAQTIAPHSIFSPVLGIGDAPNIIIFEISSPQQTINCTEIRSRQFSNSLPFFIMQWPGCRLQYHWCECVWKKWSGGDRWIWTKQR